MNQLDFELNEPAQSDLNQDEIKEDISASSEGTSDEQAIKFSVKVIEALTQKMEEHNSKYERQVSLSALKKVYRRAAGNVYAQPYELKTGNGEWAMARVNAFLRLLSGDRQTLASCSASIIAVGVPVTEIDATEQWLPEEQDFITARADIEKYELNYDFKNVDELYLDDYQKLDFDFRY